MTQIRQTARQKPASDPQARIVSAIKWLELKPTLVDAPANKCAIPDPRFFTVPAAIESDFTGRIQDAIINYLDMGYKYHDLQPAADLRGVEEGYLGAGDAISASACGTLVEIHQAMAEKHLPRLRESLRQSRHSTPQQMGMER